MSWQVIKAESFDVNLTRYYETCTHKATLYHILLSTGIVVSLLIHTIIGWKVESNPWTNVDEVYSCQERWMGFIFRDRVFEYNTYKHESSLYTPFELMFGRGAVISIDVKTEKKEENELLNEYLTNTSVC